MKNRLWMPLSAAQRSRWFLYQLDPENQGAHNNVFSAVSRSDINVVGLSNSLAILLERHPLLRSRFRNRAGEPEQSVDTQVVVPIRCFDVHDLEAAALEQRVATDALMPFDVSRAPLMRAHLYRRSADYVILMIAFDHLVCDGWSYWQVLHELGSLLASSDRSTDQLDSGERASYADYVFEQQGWLGNGAAETQRRYWLGALAGELPILDLFTTGSSLGLRSRTRALASVSIDAELTHKLHGLSKAYGGTLFTTLLAGYYILLQRYTSQEEIVVGSPMPGRTNPAWDQIVGDFVNPVALKVSFDGDPTTLEFLRQVRNVAFRGIANQDYPFAEVVEQLHASGDGIVHPIFQAAFVFQRVRGGTDLRQLWRIDGAGQTVEWGGVRLERFPVHQSGGNTGLALTLETVELQDGIRCDFRATCQADAAGRLGAHFLAVLNGMVAEPGQSLSRIPLLSELEREQLLSEFNASQQHYSADRLVHELFEEQVVRQPEAIALVYEQQSLSYGELNRRANQVAHYLIGLGARPDQRVVIYMERGLEMIVALLGILKAGAAYVPLDPAYPAARRASVLDDSEPAAILTQASLRNTLVEWGGPESQIPIIAVDGENQAALAQQPGNNPDPRAVGVTPRHLAYVIYTSGSTGTPKGVMIEHRSVVNLWRALQHAVYRNCKVPSLVGLNAPLSFDASVKGWIQLLSGHCLVIVPQVSRLGGEALFKFAAEQGIDVLDCTPTQLQQIFRDDIATKTIDRPITVLVGGEAINPGLWEAMRSSASLRFYNVYGPTECTVDASVGSPDDNPHGPHIGAPLPNTEVYILDRHLQPVPIGARGELYIGGVQVARGYLNRPELTSDRFIADPFRPGNGRRLYKTGDLGRWLPDGNIEYLGRGDFQVKIRGFRIELGEIEAKLAECEGVKEAVVIAREDVPGEKRLVAYVVGWYNEGQLSPATLRQQVSAVLPDYMVPSAFVLLERLPLTPNGKLDGKALPAPDQSAVVTREYEAPVGEVEGAIAQVWQELLGLDRVGRHDHFFELGGHSLLIIPMIGQLRQRGINVDVRTIFSAPTIAGVAMTLTENGNLGGGIVVPRNLIEEDDTAITSDMLPLVDLSQEEIDRIVASVPGGVSNVKDIYPLVPSQEGLLFHHLLRERGDAYILRSIRAFDNRERLDAFLRALQLVINRHDILRSSIRWEGLAQPVQVVHRKAFLEIEELEPASRGRALADLIDCTSPSHVRLELTRPPLAQAYVMAGDLPGEWLLAVLYHHIACDHVSLELILSEIWKIQNGELELPDPVPYRNFVAHSLLVNEKEHAQYFRKELADIDEPTAPFGILGVYGDQQRVNEARIILPADLARRIRESASRAQVTSAVLFHVAWACVVGRCSGRHDVVFGTVLSGRMRNSTAGGTLLGHLINTLPLRIRLLDVTVRDAVRQTYSRLGELLEHEQASLAVAQRHSAIPTVLPLFTCLLNYRHTRPEVADETLLATRWGGMRVLREDESDNYPMAVSVDDLAGGFRVTAQSVANIDARRLVEYLETAIGELVEGLEKRPSTLAHRLNILPASERKQLLMGLNSTERDYRSERRVHELFEEQVAKNPERVAVVVDEKEFSYGALNARANQLAGYLRGLGVSSDKLVGLFVDRSVDMITGVLGILKAGGAYVPLDPSYPDERLTRILNDVSPTVLLTQEKLGGRVDTSGVTTFCFDRDAEQLSRYPTKNLGSEGTPEDLVYVLYTSGSTGTPKGVALPHRALVNLLEWDRTEVPNRRRVLQYASITFDASVYEMFATWNAGGTVFVVPAELRKDVEGLSRFISKKAINAATLPGSVLQAVLEAGKACGVDLESLEEILVSGEALVLTPDMAEFIARKEGRRLHNHYGPSEAQVVTSYTMDSGGVRSAGRLPPIGRPIANTQIYILDEHAEPVPMGVVGEVYIGGVQLARGYLNRPKLTAERFITDPFRPGEGRRLYKTGDLGRWLPDGNIEYLGRNDFQVKIRGFRIELGEIEAKLAECEGLREAVVIVREDVAGEKRLVAYVVGGAGSDVSPAALREKLGRVLPDYMVPSAFVVLEQLPLTPNGKLDRKALPAPDQSAVVRREYEAPVGEVEETIAQVWQELLGLDRVGRHDHFFELGGHSLLAIQVVSRLRQALGIEVPLRTVFAAPTVAGFALALGGAQETTIRAISGADRNKELPLSLAQQRLWFLDQLDRAAGAAYHMPAALRLTGELQRDALRRALARIVARHESLRTRFVSVEGTARQVIDPPGTGFSLREQDLRELEGAALEAKIAEISAAEASAPFDLAAGPLIRGQLLQVGEEEHILLVTQHHIISDGWSIGILVREVSALYDAFSRGEEDPLPELKIQYADYAVWQREWLAGEALEGQIEFWREHLQGAPELLALPTDRPRPAEQSYQGSSVAVTLPAELTRGLRELSQRQGTTLFMTLLAGWSALLSRLSGQTEVVVGTPVANRQRTEVESLIGFFVNTLALRVKLEDDPTVEELLAQVKTTTVSAYAHQDVPFDQVVEAVQPMRTLSHSPLFQVEFAFNNTPGGERLELSGLTLSQLGLAKTTSHFDLSLFLSEVDDCLVGSLDYASDLFNANTIERIVNYLLALLAGMVEAPAELVSKVRVLSGGEREQLLVEFNATEREYPAGRLIHGLFEEQAREKPEATALVYEEERLSYGELNRRANQVAHYLIGLGVRPDGRVAICMERSVEMVVGLLGILKAGGAYVPLDPEYPAERLTSMLEDSRPVAVLTQERLREKVAQLNGAALEVPLAVLDQEVALAEQPDFNPDPAAIGLTAENLAYVIYTSGSTGRPKGVMNEHGGVVNRLLWAGEQFSVTANDRVLQKTPFSFDVSVGEFFLPFLAGAQLVLARPRGHVDPQYLAEVIEGCGITITHFVPSMLEGFLNGAEVERCHGIRHVLCSGEALSYGLKKRFEEALPGVALHNLYGPTEAAVEVTYLPCSSYDAYPPIVPIGRPIANTQIYILDHHLEPVPTGVVGQLYIGGVQVARGYLNRPELTAERFIADPFKKVDPTARLYKTGDLCRWLPDGNIEYLGRNDFQVKIRGYRIELGEIEAKLTECEGVREAVVIAREDVPGEKRLVAYLVAHDGVEVSPAALREQLGAVLPDYMVPSAFMVLEQLRLTPNGKLDREALPAPDQAAVVSREYEAPVGEVEEAIAQVWQELLGLDRVGRHDNFFELGGHSLLAIQVVSRLRQVLGTEAPLRGIFTSPTVVAFGRALGGAQEATLAAISVADRNKELPLSLAQQRLWFLDQLDRAAAAAYHMPAALRLTGELKRDTLQRALNRIVARHESLRTRFVSVEGTAQQVIDSAGAGFSLREHDLRHLEGAALEQKVKEISAAEGAAPFDLATGPLLRGQLLRVGEEEHILLVTQHHIISDGWSIGILVREVSALYDAFSRGEEDPLPELKIQYADYAVWQREWLAGEALEGQIEFWREHLQGAPELLALPTDRPRPAEQSYKGSSLAVTLPAELTQELRELSRRQGTTLFMTLLAGWSALLCRLSGQTEVVIGTPVANRQRTEVEPLIGFFVNTLALRVKLEEDPTVEGLLEQVKATTLSAYAHQDVPFEQVVEALQPTRTLGYTPLFQAELGLNNTPRGESLTLPRLELSRVTLPKGTAHFDVSLLLNEVDGGLVGSLVYAVDLFDASTIERIIGYFIRALEGMVVQPHERVSRLPLLSEPERKQLLAGLNSTERDYRSERRVHELFEEQVAKNPERVAVVVDEKEFSYGALNARANQLAGYLRGLGVSSDKLVGLFVDRSVDMITGVLGILKAGGAYVPLDPSYPDERLTRILNDVSPTVLLTQEKLGGRVDTSGVTTFCFDRDAEQLSRYPTENLGSEGTPEDLAYVLYTSGSTGTPKGVALPHRGLVNLLEWEKTLLGNRRRVLQLASIAFDVSFQEMFSTWNVGGTLFVVPADSRRDIARLAQFISRQGIDAATFPGSVLQALIHAAPQGGASLDSLKEVTVTGEALVLTPDIVDFIAINPERRLHNQYGPSETHVVTNHTMNSASVRDAAKLPPIGRPLPNSRIYILDQHLEPVPSGAVGELYIGGVQVGRGYLKRPELTAERFMADPFRPGPGRRLYKTGDLGRWGLGGNIEYVGRNDFQVKIRGFRVELGEIEVKLGGCDDVREAVVIAREDVPGQKRLVAYVIGRDGAELSPAELREQLGGVLPEYMIPSAFVQLPALPLTPNGKLDRRALPAPDESAAVSREFEAPVGEVEEAIAQVWQELLGVERVGRQDHFFELGGHSLLIIAMIERLRERGLKVDMRTVFVAPTIRALAATSTAKNETDDAFVVPANLIPPRSRFITPEMLPLVSLSQEDINRIVARVVGGAANIQDIYPLGPLQEGILFHHLLESDRDTYLMRSALAFENRTRLDHFLEGLQEVVTRHDILRTAVRWEGLPRPVQVVYRSAPVPVEEISLDDHAGGVTEFLVRTDPRQLRLDVERAPLLMAYTAKDHSSGEWLLALLNHHLISDHVGLELVQKEIQLLLEGKAQELAEPVPYRNFIARVRKESEEEHERYFRRELGEVEEPTAPFGIVDVHGDGGRVKEARRSVEESLGRRIREVARAEGVTPAVLFHVAWGQVLARCSGREEVVFGTVLSGRQQGAEGADRMLGLFINTLPVRVRLGQRSVREVVRETYERLGELLEHEHASLALAQRCSRVSAPLPLFTTLLNYRHTRSFAWKGMRLLGWAERTNYPIDMSIDDLGDGFDLMVHSVESIAPARIASYLETAIAELVDALDNTPTIAAAQLDILPASERQQLLVEFNGTGRKYSTDRLVHQVFEEQAVERPEAIALRFEEESLTYGELNRRANRIAHYLIELGVKPDDRVALCLERGLDLVVALIGVLKAGGAYVPLEPHYPAERLAYMLEDSRPVALLTQKALREDMARLNGVNAKIPALALDDEETLKLLQQPEDNPDSESLGLSSGNLAYVIYTSGSTGKPKGVMVEHGNLSRLFTATEDWFGFGPDDVWTLFHSVGFDFSVWEIWGALLYGGRLVVVSELLRRNPAEFYEMVCREGVTVLNQTPTAFRQLILAQVQSQKAHALRYIIFGGEALEFHTLAPWIEQNDPEQTRLINMYGITEITVHATYRPISGRDISTLSGSVVGAPIPDLQIYVLDQQLQPVPLGVAGELYVGGNGVARGYLDRPELTAERFIADPFNKNDPTARLYKTGDLGRWLPNGDIEYLGRNDFQVKIRGFRIELGEIEAKLAECEGVNEAVVIAREDAPGEKRLVAYLVGRRDKVEVSPAALRQQLSGVLPEYMVPSAFVVLEQLPLTPNGKLDRRALPSPGQSAVVKPTYEAPVGEVEQTIAEIWQELLGLERVGRQDHFFELGGHSLLAVQLKTRIRERLTFQVSLRDIFLVPVLSSFADHVIACELKRYKTRDIADIEKELSFLSEDELRALVSGDEQELSR